MQKDEKINYFLVTDLHINHSNIIKYSVRPHNYQEKIYNNWKNIVKPKDIVINLGDVIFHKAYQLKDIMNDLPGTKILVRGNHDKRHSDSWFLKRGFSFVCNSIIVNDILLSHKPMDLTENVKMNIHGHFHNNPVDHWEENLLRKISKKHFLLSIEHVGYCPVLLENCIKGKHIINSFELINA